MIFFLFLFSLVSSEVTPFNCGNDVTCSFDSETKKFTISGNGTMNDYLHGTQPWNSIIGTIKTVEIGNEVQSVGNYSFSYGSAIQTVTLGTSLKRIGQYSFSNLNQLKKIVIPKSVDIIQQYGFSYCNYLSEIVFEDNSLAFIAEGAFQNCGSYLSTGFDIVFPKGIKTIGKSAFAYSKVQNIEFKGVEMILTTAFSGCNSLKNVNISSSIVSISADSFNYCNNLESINVEKGSPFFKSIDGILMQIHLGGDVEMINYPPKKIVDYKITIPEGTNIIGKSLFSYKSLTEIQFPSSLKIIREQAFSGNAFKILSFNEGLTTIEKMAFSGCSQLHTIVFSRTISTVEMNTFENCNAISKFVVVEGNAHFSSSDDILYSNKGEVVIRVPPQKEILSEFVSPASLRVVYHNAFRDNSYLVTVKLTGIVDTIQNYAFYGCKKLEKVIIDAPVAFVGYQTFYGCIALKEVTLGDNVKIIGQSMFTSYSSVLETVILGKGIRSIEKDAFKSTKIKQIVIPDSCETIRSSAFENCKELENVTIGKGVVSIGKNAFSGCEKLKSITMESSTMWRIDDYAFKDTKISQINIPSTVEIINDGAFSNIEELQSVSYKGSDQPAYCSPKAFSGSNTPSLNLDDKYPQQEFCGVRIEKGDSTQK